jgi:4-amino-4-deoxy-L-arabinose transferase-like glycosyltransferase
VNKGRDPKWRRPVLVALLAIAAAVVLAFIVSPLALTRDVEFKIDVQNAGPAWSIDWSPGLATPRNGHWIDLSEAVRQPAPPALSTEPGQPLTLRVRLASYANGDIGLRWHDSAGARLRLDAALVDDTVLGGLTRRHQLSVVRVDGGSPNSSSRSSQSPLPLDVQCSSSEGGVYFNCPEPPARWFPVLATCAGFVGGFAVMAALLWMLAGALEARPRRTPLNKAPSARLLTVLAAVIVVVVPVWMAWWAPMIVSGDGIQYMQLALQIMRTHSFAAFDGWRLPGYSALLIPFIAAMDDFVRGVGGAHAAMAMLSSLLAWDLLRRRLSCPWPQIGAILIAIDPALVMWQRTVLTEQQTMFFVMLGAWLLVRASDQIRPAGKVTKALPWAIALGVAIAAGCYTRPNVQVLAVLAPCALWIQAWRVRRWSAAAVGAACLLTAALLLAPIFAYNARTFSRTSLAVGADWNRAVWAWEDGLMDWNQSGVFTFAQFRELRALCKTKKVSSFAFPDHAQRWRTPPAPLELNPQTQKDWRAGLLWRESAARRGDGFLAIIPRAFASLMGVPVSTPAIFHNDARFLLSPLLGDASQCPDGTNWLSGFEPQEERRFVPTAHPIGGLADSRCARFFGAAFSVWAVARPLIAGVFLFAVVVLLRRGDWAYAALGLILLAHMAAVAVLVFCGNDRYAMPWYGLMTVVALVGLCGCTRTNQSSTGAT